MSFRDNLQHLRATRNMTQEQLAMLLGVSRQSVTKWEAEKASPEMDKLLKICSIFDCTLDELVQGDLTGRAAEPARSMPIGAAPTDVCGYDEHQRKMAWRVPTGVAAIIAFVGVGLLFEGAAPFAGADEDILMLVMIFIGVLAGLAFLVPAGMDHSAFVKAHPFVEDFYTDDDKAAARKAFAGGLIAGLAFIFAGIGCMLMLEASAQGWSNFFLLFFIALGVWNIMHYGMLLGRTNLAEYNKSVAEELELEEITSAAIDEARREALLERRRASKRVGAVCAVIMIVATIVGLLLLFVPVLTSPDPDSFEPEGTSAMWFWLAWVVGGLLCGIAATLMDAFGRRR